MNAEWQRRARKRDRWTLRWRIEQLTQLKADIESAWHRYLVECLRMQVEAPEIDREQWIVAAREIEEQGQNMMRQLDRWIDEFCRQTGGCGDANVDG